jgi:hypothetical protein
MGLITRLALSFACSFFLCSSASAIEPPAGIPEVGEVGRGEFSRFGFRVYEARLWAPSGRYVPHLPFALSLTYQRSIDGARIVQASLDEIAKLGVPIDAHPQWRDQLARVLPDVVPGDTLTGVYQPGDGATFYHQGQLTGRIDDSLARAFFSIWLDPRTSEPSLRQALLGVKP